MRSIMAANESLTGVPASRGDGLDDVRGPLDVTSGTTPVRRSAASRGTMTQIYVFSALFWTALFILHTTQMMLASQRDDWRSIRWRFGMSVLAVALCLPLGWVIRRTLNRSLPRRLLAIVGACVPIAIGYAIVGHIVWIDILESGVLPYSATVGIIIQSQYNLILFLLWCSFCAAILYAAQLQERERSLLEAQALAHEAELKMLRYQINPHFLFNTLNAVSALIVTGQTLAADAMIGKLARFFRNALSRESTAKVTLAADVRVQLEYLNIELTRFPDRLSWSTSIEPGLENALVPHLILQPLFENAIKHGVARSGSPVEIRLAAIRRSGQLIITVDNDVRPASQPGPSAGAGVGLANVARRLASFYGSDAALSATHVDDRYRVELRLPIELTL
jgi:two-component system, LytTR family, sensor kinase